MAKGFSSSNVFMGGLSPKITILLGLKVHDVRQLSSKHASKIDDCNYVVKLSKSLDVSINSLRRFIVTLRGGGNFTQIKRI